MPRTFTHLLVHVIFSTKNHSPWLSADIIKSLGLYLSTKSAELKSPIIAFGGHLDHVHILMRLAPTQNLSYWIKTMKLIASPWLKSRYPNLTSFCWQEGYGAFSVSLTAKNDVKKYINNQEQHHHRLSAHEEWQEFLNEHGINPETFEKY